MNLIPNYFIRINFNPNAKKVIEVLTFGKFYLGNKKDILIFDAKSCENFLKFVNTIFFKK